MPVNVGGEGRGGGGGGPGGGGGGTPAVILRQNSNSALGLVIGLIREDAGADWALDATVRAVAAQASLTYGVSQTQNIRITIPASLSSGADSNGWVLRATNGTAQTASIDAANKQINLVVSGRTYTQVIALLTGLAELSAGDITLTGSGSTTFPAPTGTTPSTTSSGGRDADPIAATIDEANKTVTIDYLSTDTQQQVFDALDEFDLGSDALLRLTPIHGTNLTAVPEPPPFTNRPFIEFLAGPGVDTGSTPSTGTAPLTDAQIKAAYERNADTNAFTDALLTKLNGIAENATAVTIGNVLTQIMAGTGININRATAGQITISATGGGGGGTADGVVSGGTFNQSTQVLTLSTSEGGSVTVNLANLITENELPDKVGAMLAALGQFSYNATTNVLSFVDNSITAAQARATSDAHRREWRNRLGTPDIWSDIAANTAIGVGKIVYHAGDYYGCITAHNRSGTGPNGDSTNWILLSTWGGNWAAGLHPRGAVVLYGGNPWLATQNVVGADPAPDAATNTKWVQLGGAVPTAGTPPREITPTGNVYTLLEAENEIHVDVTITHNTAGTRTYTERILRDSLTSTPADRIIDGRNPVDHQGDADNRFIGFSASISGNDVTLATGTFSGTIARVWGVVSGARGEQGNAGPAGPSGDRLRIVDVGRSEFLYFNSVNNGLETLTGARGLGGTNSENTAPSGTVIYGDAYTVVNRTLYRWNTPTNRARMLFYNSSQIASQSAGDAVDGSSFYVYNTGDFPITVDAESGKIGLAPASDMIIEPGILALVAIRIVGDRSDSTRSPVAEIVVEELGEQPIEVETKTADYTIVPGDRNKTIVLAGDTRRTFTLPEIGGAVHTGWTIDIGNDTTDTLVVEASGSNTLETGQQAPFGSISITPGAFIEFRVITDSRWIAVSDTRPTDLRGYAELAGDTFTGPAKGIPPVEDDDFTRKDYVDDSSSSTASTGISSRDHERISALEAKTQGLVVRDHEVWSDIAGIADFAVFLIPSPVSGLTAALPTYAWATNVAVPSDGNYIVAVRLRAGRHINWIRVVRDDDGGVEQAVYREGFHYAGLEQGGFDYYIQRAEAMQEDDVLTLQYGLVDAHTEFEDRVTDLVEHEADPGAHQDSPRRLNHLGLSAPAGRRIYLTEQIRHPIQEGILEVSLGSLPPSITDVGGRQRNRWIGASVIDFSGEGGPEATVDQSGFPAFMNVARIAGIWQGNALVNPTDHVIVAVLSTLQTAAPTFLHVNIPNDRVVNPNDRKIALTELRTVTIGGRTYRLMRMPVQRAYFNDISSRPFRFALEYAGGFLQPDGSVDTGVTHNIGTYVSLGTGQWESDEIEGFARQAVPGDKFPESRYNLRDGQLVYGPAINFAAGTDPLGNNEWMAHATNSEAVILNFTTSGDATNFLQHYPEAQPLRVGDEEYIATVTRVSGSDTGLIVDIGQGIPPSWTGTTLRVRFHSELVSADRSTTIARGAASGAVASAPVRRYTQHVELFGRFTQAELSGGVPSIAPALVFDDLTGPGFVDPTNTRWTFPASGVPSGSGDLWRATTSFAYFAALIYGGMATSSIRRFWTEGCYSPLTRAVRTRVIPRPPTGHISPTAMPMVRCRIGSGEGKTLLLRIIYSGPTGFGVRLTSHRTASQQPSCR